MRRTEVAQEIRKMQFESAYTRWTERRITQEQAAKMLGVSTRTFRRHIFRYEQDGIEGILDKRITKASSRRAPVDEVFELCNTYQTKHWGWNVSHFHSWYKRQGGERSYTWVKNTLQKQWVDKKIIKERTSS